MQFHQPKKANAGKKFRCNINEIDKILEEEGESVPKKDKNSLHPESCSDLKSSLKK